MIGKYICGGDKYIRGGRTDVIYINLSIENLPEEISVEGYTLYFPNFFHISLIYIGHIIKKYNITIPDFSNKIVEDFCDFTATNEIAITRYKNEEYRFVSRESKKTVVVMCEVSNLNKFFDYINKKYGLNIKHPAPHVTLYGNQKNEPGVYLMDEDDIKNFTVPIENPLGFNL